MRHLGSVTDINGALIEPVDCITGGSPCQDLSVAGKRAGLAGERSGLFMEQVRIVKEMRNATIDNRGLARPRFMVWENVAGAFSSNGGKDFQAVLTEIVRIKEPEAPDVPLPEKGRWPHAGELHDEMGRWSVAYRLHDAQYWGVPQRRKRIALVADFEGGAAAEILFEQYSGSEPRPEIQPESDSLPRDIKQSGTQGEETAGTVRESTAETGGGTYDVRISSDGTQNWRAHCYETEISRALDTGGENPDSNHGGVAITYGISAYGIDQQGGKGNASYTVNVSPTLASNSHGTPHGVCYGISAYESNAMKSSNPHSGIYEADADHNTNSNNVCRIEANVRRLTPTECSRLQGFPDKWVDIGDWYDSKGKLHKDADSPKYKALGNSIALPFWFWLLRRISAQYTRQATLGSLFSGIGGFDICWELCNGAGTARWQSEIEEFPIAVCKRRFGDEATGEKGDAWKYLSP